MKFSKTYICCHKGYFTYIKNLQNNNEYFLSIESSLTRSDYFADSILNEANDDDPRIIPPISDLVVRENLQFAISEILSSLNE